MTPLHELSVAEAGRLLRSGELTSTALTEHALARVAALDPVLHAFVLVTEQRAIDDAARADRELASGLDRGPMHGIPYGLKDVFATAGIPTTCHSKVMVGNVPAEDSAVEARLRAGGGVLVGKLASHEFALGGPSYELPFPPARNPWNPAHVPGASSSGSAVAVAAGLVPVAMGTDTSGSIRGPACHCGTVGLKPTYGLVSRRGAFPLSWSLDHCGPLTWRVDDAALVLQVVAGHDPLDPASADVAVPSYAAHLDRGIAGLRIALPRHLLADAPSAEVVASIEAAAETLAGLGAEVDVVRVPDYDLFNACGRTIMAAEAFAVHERDLRERPLDYGRYTYQRIVPGATVSAADLLAAMRLRRELAAALEERVFADHDAMVTACALAPAARFEDFPPDWPPPREATATQTILFNVTGHPALAVPTGFSLTGLPLGLQVVGRAFDEATVLRIGAAYRAATGLADRRPPVDAAAGAGVVRSGHP